MYFSQKQENPLMKLTRSYFILLAFITFIPMLLNGQEKTVSYYLDPSGTPPDLPVTIHHLNAYIGFLPEKNRVEGTAEFFFSWNGSHTDSIVFYTPDFQVSAVLMDSLPVPFHQSGVQLIINPPAVRFTSLFPALSDHSPSKFRQPENHRITIKYSATPLAGHIYFIGWRPEESGKRKQIWAHRPHGWIPYIDGRITVDIFVTFDQDYKVFSNGERIAVKNNRDGTKTWHYAMKKDHPFFSTSLVIGDYEYTGGKTARGLPLEFWYYPEMADRISTTYRYTERMFDFLEGELGFRYPYPLYREAPVIDYMYGAMETTTATVFGDYMQITPRSWWQRNYVNVNCHELAHQWFGNCIAHFVNKDVWLTESFATYYAKLFEKNLYGEDYWQNLRNDEINLAFEAAAKNSYPVASSLGGVQRIYQKGSLVLEMLRNVTGNEEFRKSVNLYLNRYAFSYAETNDFMRCVYDACGKSYHWFFDEWILRGGEPDYLVSDSLSRDSTGVLMTVFKVKQVQPVNELNGLFRMPVRFEVHYADQSSDSLDTWIQNRETLVRIPNLKEKPIDYLLFDPGRKILKKINFRQSPERLKAQALKAKNMIDRYDALVALRDLPLDQKIDFLASAYQHETFHLTKSEILRQTGNDTGLIAKRIFGQALTDPSAIVRKTVLQVMNPAPASLRTEMEKLLYDSSFLNVELALENLCRSCPGNTAQYLEMTKDMEGWRGKNIRMKWLEISIGSGQQGFLNEVVNYCSPRYEFETRMNAFGTLKRLHYYDSATREYADLASKHWNNKLSGAAKDYLKAEKP